MAYRVLVADDAPMVEGFMREAMRMAGHEVAGVAKNGHEAVELYKTLKPDLVTLDLNMPEMNGLEALKKILSFNPKAKVLMVTAMNQRFVRHDLLKAGARRVLGKPIRLVELVRTVGEVLSERE